MQFTVTCKRCNRKVPTSEVRILPDKSYICFSCAGYAAPKKEDTVAEKPAKLPKVKYQCQKCKYEFYLKEGHAKICPYCAGANVIEKQFEAQKLIDMPGHFRDDE